MQSDLQSRTLDSAPGLKGILKPTQPRKARVGGGGGRSFLCSQNFSEERKCLLMHLLIYRTAINSAI